jgi:hypothetical protein
MEIAATLPRIRQYNDQYWRERERQEKEIRKIEEEQDPEVK